MKAEMTFYVKEKTQPETRCCTFDGTQKGLGEMIGSILTDPSFRSDNTVTVKAAGEICRVNTAKRGSRTVNGEKLAQFHITGVSNAIPVSPSHPEERELRCINPEGNNYKKYFIIPEAGGIQGAYGSIDVPKDKCRRTKDLYPDPLYAWLLSAEKISKGYVDVTKWTNCGNGEPGLNADMQRKDADAADVNARLYAHFLEASQNLVARSFAQKSTELTSAMAKEARNALERMRKAMTEDDLDGFVEAQLWLMLFAAHKRDPLAGDKIRDYLPKTAKDMPGVFREEEMRILSMETVVSGMRGAEGSDADSFRKFQVHIWKANPEQERFVLDRMEPSSRKKVVAIYKVRPDRQRKAFARYRKEQRIYGSGNGLDDLGIQHYWHSTDDSNWESIIRNGLQVMGKASHGRMFGSSGSYFAPSFDKAKGYCSCSTRWNIGNRPTGFVGLFAVPMGKPMYAQGPGHYSREDLKAAGKQSLYARASDTGLRADECVCAVSCLEYLVEVSA